METTTTYYEPHSAIIEVEKWKIHLVVDSDGHLNVHVNHKDKSPVIECDHGDIGQDENDWAERFTTEKIESNNSEN